MNKKYFYISAILLLFSCNKKENTNTELNIDSIENSIETKENSTENEVKNNIAFDDSKTFEELYELPEYEKLQKDETFKKYISEVIETNIEVRQKFFDAEKTIGKSVDLDEPAPNTGSEQKEALWDIGKMAKNMVVDGVKIGIEGYKLNELDNKKKKIYSTFSSDKKNIAQNFETSILKIIDDSYNLPTNSSVGKKSKYKNYRSISKTLSSDSEAKEYAKNLGDIADDYFLKAFQLREKIQLNKKLGENSSTSSIKKISEEILKNPEISAESNSTILSEYFESLKNLSESLNNQNFNVPVEDWSEERKNNFNFIISDIKTKVNGIIESI
jgi:hypothetical protein